MPQLAESRGRNQPGAAGTRASPLRRRRLPPGRMRFSAQAAQSDRPSSRTRHQVSDYDRVFAGSSSPLPSRPRLGGLGSAGLTGMITLFCGSPGVPSMSHDVAPERSAESFCNTSRGCGAHRCRCSEARPARTCHMHETSRDDGGLIRSLLPARSVHTPDLRQSVPQRSGAGDTFLTGSTLEPPGHGWLP
jgi:hypothetical protein